MRSLGWDLLNMINLRLDVLMLRLLSTSAATGAYALSAQFSEVVWLVPSSVGVAVFPEVAGGGHEQGTWTARVCRLTSALGILLAIAVGVSASLLIIVLLPAYRSALPALWLLLPGTAVASIAKILVVVFLAAGRLAAGFFSAVSCLWTARAAPAAAASASLTSAVAGAAPWSGGDTSALRISTRTS